MPSFGIRVDPGKKFALKSVDPDDTGGFKGKDDPRVAEQREADIKRLAELQQRFLAEKKHALLVVLQAMDTAGKDGVLRHVVGPLDSRGASVVSFKAPCPDELAHDFLWRVHSRAPAKGEMVFWNRSHYEDVLVVRVLGLKPEHVWKRRYGHINDFERMLTDEGTRVVKFYLHISKDEQKERLQERIDEPEKRWKFDPGDLDMRRRWGDFQDAYDDMLERCSTEHAPWYVVPANKKWYRDLVVARRLVEVLEDIGPRFPEPKGLDFSKIVID